MANFVPLISYGVYERSTISSANGFNGRQSAVKCTRRATNTILGGGGRCGISHGLRESGLDNNARTGYRETVAAKPRSGSRRCLN